jgi:hypothetical protein
MRDDDAGVGFEFDDEELERLGRIVDAMVAGTATEDDRHNLAAVVVARVLTNDLFEVYVDKAGVPHVTVDGLDVRDLFGPEATDG